VHHLFSAPEVLRNEAYDESADAFSFAATLVAFFKKGRAYDRSESFRLHAVRFNGKRPSIPPRCPVAALIEECWAEDARQRPPFSRIVAKLEAELERLAKKAAAKGDAAAAAATEAAAAVAAASVGLISREVQLLREVRRREQVLRATFEAAQDAETDAELAAALAEAAEELRSMTIDPIVRAALVDTHDDPRGFVGQRKREEEEAREAAEAAAAARARGPDAPPGEWTDDEVLEAVAESATARGWAFACARGAESEAEFAAKLDARLLELARAEAAGSSGGGGGELTVTTGRFEAASVVGAGAAASTHPLVRAAFGPSTSEEGASTPLALRVQSLTASHASPQQLAGAEENFYQAGATTNLGGF